MRLKTVLPVLVAVAASALAPGRSRAATIQYDISGTYKFDSLPPGFPVTGTFDWNTSTGLGGWNITLADFPAGTLTNGSGGAGQMTGIGFQFEQTDDYLFGSQQFILTGKLNGSLPTVLGEHTTFTGTYIDNIFLNGAPAFQNLFTVSGTVSAASFIDAPEPATFALGGLGALAVFWLGRRRLARQ